MQCPKCHGNIPDNSKFCTLCGTRIETAQPAGPGAAPEKSNIPAPAAENNVSAALSKAKAQLDSNVKIDFSDLKKTNSMGIMAGIVVGWLLVLLGCFINTVKVMGIGYSFSGFSDLIYQYAKMDMQLGWVIGAAVAFVLFGAFILLRPRESYTRKLETVFGTGSLMGGFVLTLIVYFLWKMLSAVSSYGLSFTFFWYVLMFAVLAVFVLSWILLCRLATRTND